VSSGSGKEMSRSAGKRAGRHRDVEEQWEDLLEVNIINQMKSIFDAKSGASNLASITSSNHAIAFSDDQFLGILAHMMIDCLEERLFRSEYTEKQIKRIEGDLRKEAGGIQIFERPQLKQLLKNMNDMYDDILLHEELNMNPGMDNTEKHGCSSSTSARAVRPILRRSQRRRVLMCDVSCALALFPTRSQL
jgi:hypothetical protein